jgi:hypothetical protein
MRELSTTLRSDPSDSSGMCSRDAAMANKVWERAFRTRAPTVLGIASSTSKMVNRAITQAPRSIHMKALDWLAVVAVGGVIERGA